MHHLYKILVCVGLILLYSCEEFSIDTSNKVIKLGHRKYDTTSSYKTNPVYGTPVEKSLNSNNDIIHPDNKIKIAGLKINSRQLPAPITFNLNAPQPIITKGIINIPWDVSKVDVRMIDSSLISKRALLINPKNKSKNKNLIGVELNAKLTKIKSEIPPLTEAKTPIYKGKAIKNIKYLDVKQGMSSSYVWDVFHDSRNQIWMGSNGGGVSIYTGDKFRHFTEENGLSNNFVWCIEEDRRGNMWFGTFGDGVCMFDGNHFFRLGLEEGFPATDITFIYEARDGVIWIGTVQHGVILYAGGQFASLTKKEGLLCDKLICIYEDEQNRKWIATENGINIIDGDSIAAITMKNGLKSPDVNRISQDQKGNIWIGYAEHGVDVFDGKSFTNYNSNNFLRDNHVYDFLLDSMNNMWIATYGGGLCQFDGKEFVWLDETNGMSGEHILKIESDQLGNIWAGTDGDGINIINKSSFENLNKANGIINDYIYTICEDKNNQIWFGGEEGELMMFKNGSYYTLPEFSTLLDKQINNIYEDSKGQIWIATEAKGVIKIKDNTVKVYSMKNGLHSNQIYDLIEDKNGVMWFGSNVNGICSYDGQVFTHYNEENGLFHNQVRTITKDFNGNLYFGTWGGGVIKYDGDYFHHITEKEGLHSSIILSSFTDSKGRVWFGSNMHGACMLDKGNFYYYTSQNGLSNNRIWSIIEDTVSNSIWIGTEKGLNQLTNTDIGLNQNYKCMSYNWNDGIRCVDFLKSCALQDHTGALWWGTGKGLTKLKRKTFSKDYSIPILRLRNVSINDRYIDYSTPPDSLKSKISFSSINKFENVPKDLILSYDHNHLTFSYSAINWFKPQGITYRYLLDGLDSKWSPPTSETHADFTNIPDGSYVFKVKAKIAGGKWSEPIEYPFTINPPWWLTWWAKISYVALITVLIWLLILQRTRNLKLRQLRLLKEIKKATKEIREKKNEVERQKNSNLEMSKRILEQDKQLILSATANTVAHGLNSPLGAIKAGAEGISYIYNHIFSNVIQKCSPHQIIFGYKYAKKFNGKQLESGKEFRSRFKVINESLTKNYSLSPDEASDLSSLINKVYLDSELKSLIEFVLKQENRLEVLEMIISLVSFEKITSNTLNATKQSSKVVESLKKALKKGRVEEKGAVKLNKSISAVIEVLNEDIQKRAKIQININSDLVYKNANQYKFFQLWSNIFTLLLNSSKEKIIVIINSNEDKSNLNMTFEVDLRLESNLFDDSVYDMIMNRQKNSLDLSRAVIKDIVQEYHGTVNISNTNEKSKVNIKLPIS